MIPSAYLKADDVTETGTVLTVKALTEQEFDKNGSKEKKWVLEFVEIPKKLTLNKTNMKTMFGHYADTDHWIGKPFIFQAREVQDPSGKMVMSVRVSLRKPAAAPKAVVVAPAIAGEDTPF